MRIVSQTLPTVVRLGNREEKKSDGHQSLSCPCALRAAVTMRIHPIPSWAQVGNSHLSINLAHRIIVGRKQGFLVNEIIRTHEPTRQRSRRRLSPLYDAGCVQEVRAAIILRARQCVLLPRVCVGRVLLDSAAGKVGAPLLGMRGHSFDVTFSIGRALLSRRHGPSRVMNLWPQHS